jgi:hypothetical protein
VEAHLEVHRSQHGRADRRRGRVGRHSGGGHDRVRIGRQVLQGAGSGGPTGTLPGQATTSQPASPESLSLTASATPEPRPRQVFAGWLVIPEEKDGEKKDLDTVPPRNTRYGEEGGDISYDPSFDWLEADDTGASLGQYTGEGNPTLAQYEHAAQAGEGGKAYLERRAWICILTEEGSVVAFKISTVGRAVEGQATIWHTQ